LGEGKKKGRGSLRWSKKRNRVAKMNNGQVRNGEGFGGKVGGGRI